MRESRQETSNLHQCRGSAKGGRVYFNFFHKHKGIIESEGDIKKQGSFVDHSVIK